jgi:hypothetical protein
MELNLLTISLIGYGIITTLALLVWYIRRREYDLRATIEELIERSEEDLDEQQEKYEKQIEKLLDKHTKEIDKLEADIDKRIVEQEHKLVVEKMKNDKLVNDLKAEYTVKLSDALNSSSEAVKNSQVETERVKNQLYNDFYTKAETTNQAYQSLYKEIISNNHAKLNVNWDTSRDTVNQLPTNKRG